MELLLAAGVACALEILGRRRSLSLPATQRSGHVGGVPESTAQVSGKKAPPPNALMVDDCGCRVQVRS